MAYNRPRETQKPETALRRANELIAQEQPGRALNTLHDVISNKRNRVWQGIFEDIMLKHLDLCVIQRKGKHARDGLIQYRAVCQQVNVGSLDKVIKYFLERSEQKVKDAQANSEDAARLLAGQDLDAENEHGEESPESVMMRAVAGETTKDRTDREYLMPWVKFLWESHRTVLDVTRTNPKLEQIYHETARKAFTFCQRYQRKVEFRRLCDLLRQHHAQKSKYYSPEQRAQIQQSAESFNLYIETRFKQLQVATALDLWQEAYRSIEDIHGITQFFKRPPPTKQMIEYFDKLTRVFWVARNYLFHAYACLKHHTFFALGKQQKKELNDNDREELMLVASRVVIATLCIPFWERNNSVRQQGELFQYNPTREKNVRITTLLGTSSVPTRASLLLDITNRKIVELCFPELRDLYDALETQFDPLRICHKINSVIPFMESKPALSGYVDILKRTAAVRMVEQFCKVYDTMTISQLCQLCPYYKFSEIEPLFVEVARQDYPGIHVTINHQLQSISFANNVVNCDTLSGQLSLLSRKLEPVVAQCRESLAPQKKPAVLGPKYFATLVKQLEIEREAILERSKVIEERKARKEAEEQQQARENDLNEARQREQMREMEVKRIQEEAQLRAIQRQKEQEQKEAESQSRALFSEIVQQKGGAQLRKAAKQDERIMNDQERLIEEAKKLMISAKEEREKRLKEEAKRIDYFERACRDEEKPILQKLWSQKSAEENKLQAARRETELKEKRDNWEFALKEKKRLARMQEQWDLFSQKLMEARRAEQERIMAEKRDEQRKQKEEKRRGRVVEEKEEKPEEEEEDENPPEEPAKEEEDVKKEEAAPAPAPKVAAWKPKSQRGPSDAVAAPPPPPKPSPPPAPAEPPAASKSTGAYVPPSQRKKT